MKNLSIILNLVLLVAVGYLYYLHHRDCSAPVSSGTVITGSGMPANAIVFINSDSLLEGYDYFNDLKDHLEQKSDSIDRVLRSRAEQLEKDVMKYQDRAPGLSPQQRAEEEEKLMARQQGLMEYKNLMLDQLSEEESVMNDSLHSNLTRFCEITTRTETISTSSLPARQRHPFGQRFARYYAGGLKGLNAQ